MNSRSIQTPDGINWHVESIQSTTGDSSPDANKEHIILIPSGEGDCHNLAALAINLASSATSSTLVTTFDMPGFSRSTAPIEAYSIITPELVAKQIITLLDVLQISQATFFGCSSGGCAVIALVALYPDRMKCGIVHEVPLSTPPPFITLRTKSDEEIIQTCREMFESWIENENDGKLKNKALGDEYFKRRDKNFVTWMRHLVTNYETRTKPLATPEKLRQQPFFWTVGGLSPRAIWEENFQVAEEAGLKVRTDALVCHHFPSVTVPVEAARWIWQCVEKANSGQL